MEHCKSKQVRGLFRKKEREVSRQSLYSTPSTSLASGTTIPAASIIAIMSPAEPEKLYMSSLDFVASKGASIDDF